MKHRKVVANFLFKSESGKTSVALFRRSTHPNVRSYQAKLAPISGSIDESDAEPLEAAARELQEETELIADEDIVLGFSGKPFSFVDEQVQRSWTVFPFGWNLKVDESKIKIDWEHSAWEWMSPQRVLDGLITDDCVPNIHKSLMRVYYGHGGIFPGNQPLVSNEITAGQVFLRTLDNLRNDKENGARILATESLRGLGEMLKEFNSVREQKDFDSLWWPSFKIAAYHFIYSGRPSMNAAIKAAILQALKPYASNITSNPPELAAVIKQIEHCVLQRNKTSEKVSTAFTQYIEKLVPDSGVSRLNLITLSSSSTIRYAILQLLATMPNLELHISILESRPFCEGVSLADALVRMIRGTPAESRLHITLAPDSHVAYLIQQNKFEGSGARSLILLGADRITPSGHVSNKMGSLALAALSKSLAPHIPVGVLSEGDKIATPSNLSVYEDGTQDPPKELEEFLGESNNIDEVTRIWPGLTSCQSVLGVLITTATPRTVRVENIYFEMIPFKFIDLYICEDGPLKREDILARSISLGRLEEQIFGDLYND